MRLMEPEAEITRLTAKGVVVRSAWQRGILTFLMVFGPGLIELLGDRWVNRPWNNYINWTIIDVLFPCRCCWPRR